MTDHLGNKQNGTANQVVYTHSITFANTAMIQNRIYLIVEQESYLKKYFSNM